MQEVVLFDGNGLFTLGKAMTLLTTARANLIHNIGKVCLLVSHVKAYVVLAALILNGWYASLFVW